MNRTVRILCALAVAAATFSVVAETGEPTWESEPARSVVADEGDVTWESAPVDAVA